MLQHTKTLWTTASSQLCGSSLGMARLHTSAQNEVHKDMDEFGVDELDWAHTGS